jgi:hypothetical protein
MIRLGEYLAELGKLFGSQDQVHFEGVVEGSCRILSRVDAEVGEIVIARAKAAARGDGEAQACKAWQTLNQKLAQDRTAAILHFPDGATLEFPGQRKSDSQLGPIHQFTVIQGRLIRLEGMDPVYVGLQDAPEIVRRISVTAALGQKLGSCFHKIVRLSGEAKWKRTASGQWIIEILEAERFEVLEDEPLYALVHQVRKLIEPGEVARSMSLLRDLNSGMHGRCR